MCVCVCVCEKHCDILNINYISLENHSVIVLEVNEPSYFQSTDCWCHCEVGERKFPGFEHVWKGKIVAQQN